MPRKPIAVLVFAGLLSISDIFNWAFGWIRSLDWLQKNTPQVWGVLVSPATHIVILVIALSGVAYGLWEVLKFKHKPADPLPNADASSAKIVESIGSIGGNANVRIGSPETHYHGIGTTPTREELGSLIADLKRQFISENPYGGSKRIALEDPHFHDWMRQQLAMRGVDYDQLRRPSDTHPSALIDIGGDVVNSKIDRNVTSGFSERPVVSVGGAVKDSSISDNRSVRVGLQWHGECEGQVYRNEWPNDKPTVVGITNRGDKELRDVTARIQFVNLSHRGEFTETQVPWLISHVGSNDGDRTFRKKAYSVILGPQEMQPFMLFKHSEDGSINASDWNDITEGKWQATITLAASNAEVLRGTIAFTYFKDKTLEWDNRQVVLRSRT